MSTDVTIGSFKQMIPEEYGISHRGVLPVPDPLTKLPKDFTFYDEFGKQIPELLRNGMVRKEIKNLPLPPRQVSALSFDEKMLLMVRLAFSVSACVNQDAHLEFTPQSLPRRIKENLRKDTSPVIIPAHIVRPFLAAAEALGIPPILSYTFYAPYNWERIDKGGQIEVSNLRTIQGFLRDVDENHFTLLHTEIENNLGPALHSIPVAQKYVFCGLSSGLADTLRLIAQSVENAESALGRMPEFCHPDVYYIRVRPYIFGLNLRSSGRQVIFEGLEEGKRMPVLRGETGAQTPSFPALWAAMGIEFSDDHLKQHVLHMREYMLPNHRAFIEAIERGPSIRSFVLGCICEKRKGSSALKEAYNRVIVALHKYFRLHRVYADLYINKKARKYTVHKEQGAYGTGGTPYMEYLTKHCQEILAHRIR